MKKSHKILLIVVIVIAIVLIINEFVLFPIFPSPTVSYSCSRPILFTDESVIEPPGLVNVAEIILIGTAGDYEWVKTDPTRGIIETYTDINVDRVLKGQYTEDEITVRSIGGCDIRSNICLRVSVSIMPEKGQKYLLFLSNTNNEGIYNGFSACGGLYRISLDNSGSEVLGCFAEDIDNCEDYYVKLDDLILQIQS